MGNGSRRVSLAMAVLLAAPLAGQEPPSPQPRQQAEDTGAELYKTYCATCHGASAKGDGPLAGQLRARPADLTQFAKRNKGKWDGDKVARIIDGRDPVKGHGGPDMPVWGDAFKGSREGQGEEAVKRRIRALAEHLESLQVPAAQPPSQP